MKIKKLKTAWLPALLLFVATILLGGIRGNSIAAAQSMNTTEALHHGATGVLVSSLSDDQKPLSPVVQSTPQSGYQLSAGHQIFLGTVPPAQVPFTHTFTATDSTGTWTTTVTVSCFQLRFVSNISPSGTVTGTPKFSWTGINDPNAQYGVELNDNSGNRIWNEFSLSGTSVDYSGPALIPGMTYTYLVLVESSSTCRNQGSSFVSGSFTYR